MGKRTLSYPGSKFLLIGPLGWWIPPRYGIEASLKRTSDSYQPILFAHRGARADAPENTLEAFLLAKEMGATGMESDVWVTSDGVAVLDHDGVTHGADGRVPIGSLRRSELPDHIPSLDEYYSTVGPEFALSLDLKDRQAFTPTVESSRRFGAESKLWICHPSAKYLATLRGHTLARLVDSTQLASFSADPEEKALFLVRHGIEGINMHRSQWDSALVETFQAHGLMVFGWDAQTSQHLSTLFSLGVDGVYSDHVVRMFASLRDHHTSEW